MDEAVLDKHRAFSATISDGGKILQLDSGQEDILEFYAVWLRHNCNCTKCSFSILEHPSQKLLRPHQLDPSITITSVEISGPKMMIGWSCGHQGFFYLDWLKKATAKGTKEKRLITKTTPRISADEVLGSDEGLWRWLKTLNDYGMCLLTGLSTEEGTIKKLGSAVHGLLHATFGEYFQVVTKEDSVADYIAYTFRSLPLHSDNVYYEHPGGVAMLHCLRNDDCLEGGLNTLLDSHILLEEFKAKYPEHFSTLTRVPATFSDIHYEGPVLTYMKHQKPHIVLDEDGQVKIFRWNPLHQGPLNVPKEDVMPYYEAYTCLAKMIEESPHIMYHKFMPGDVMTLHNWRIMHGRTEIKPNGGIRLLEGGLLPMDEFRSKFQILARKLGHEDD